MPGGEPKKPVVPGRPIIYQSSHVPLTRLCVYSVSRIREKRNERLCDALRARKEQGPANERPIQTIRLRRKKKIYFPSTIRARSNDNITINVWIFSLRFRVYRIGYIIIL